MPCRSQNLANARVIAVRRDQRAGRGAADRLHDEGQHALRTFLEDLFLQQVGIFQPALFHREIVAVEIGRRRGDLGHLAHHRGEWRGQGVIAGDGKRAERAAMVGGKARNHLPALGLVGRHRPLPRKLEAGLHRLGAARDEEDAVQSRRQFFRNPLRQLFRRFVLEMQTIGEGNAVHLPLHRVEDMAIGMADIDHHRARRPIDHAPAGLVPEVDAFRPVDQRPAQPGLIEQV